MVKSAVELRALVESEIDGFIDLDEIAFLGQPSSEQLRDGVRSCIELDRCLGAFDGADQVGGAAAFTFGLSVPGSIVPMAAVSWVAVLPTHRRQGILTRLMRRQLHELHDSGREAVAGLTASEPAIYGRFGYGQASWTASAVVPRHRNSLRVPPGTEEVGVRLVSTAESAEACDQVYRRCVPGRPGMLEFTPAWERWVRTDIEQYRGNLSELRTVVAQRDGVVVGFARYRSEWRSAVGMSASRVEVYAVFADDAAAHAALFTYLVNIDLAESTTFIRLPVDGPLMYLLADVRAAAPRLSDSLFIRLVDVDRALTGRTYAVPIDLVINVADEFCPWNARRWRLSGDEKGAVCAPTNAPADLSLGVRELGAVYLGGVAMRSLAEAGLVEAHRPGAAAEATRAFAADCAPWLPYIF